ncbi:MAG: NIPSNAP family protein [Sphingopyxis sp.]|nr:NIPSNAP family protein [Sphingopyxis sp.]
MAALATAGAHASETDDAQVIELRQYKLEPGTRDAFVALFEDKLLDSQEAVGMRLMGQFRDRDDGDRFTWIRAFADMSARERALNSFYFGPVWKANRDAANPMLIDNDNVLLLRPAAPGLKFEPPAARSAATPPKAVWAIIEYLWKRPDEGFVGLFRDRMRPALESAGINVLGAYVPVDAPNNFPQLPVREDRKLFVWFVRGESHADLADKLARARQSEHWQRDIAAALGAAEERAPQILHLDPTPQSALR